MIETIINVPAILVTYYSKSRVIYLEWKRNSSIEEYQRIMIECLEFGRNRPIYSVISDIRSKKQENSEQRKWFETQILPAAIHEFGVKRAAAIYDGSKLQEKHLKNIKKITDKYNLPLKLTTNQDTAFRWIRKAGFNLKEMLLGHIKK